MFQGMSRTGIFVAGIGTFAYLYLKKYHDHTVVAGTVKCEQSKYELQEGRASVPKKIATEGPLTLQLKQVHVMFRHGARTPLHLIPKMHEVEYDPQFMMREHQACVYPYRRLSCKTGRPIDWSGYEMALTKSPLKSGSCPGALSTYGRDQMYLLGHKLKLCYMDSLNTATYNPQEVFVLSSNIRRTVDSARCVLAGYYGKEQLRAFAANCHPVTIYVTEKDYNIMIPETITCAVMRKSNHTSMNKSDFIPGFLEDRQAIERTINKSREKNICLATAVQDKISRLCDCFEIDNSYSKMTVEHNEDRQPYLYDPVLHPLIEKRSKIISKVDRLWTDAMVRNPNLASVITEKDMKALIYLRRLEVERFTGKFRSGYRIHFYFDPNPYFHNEHLCKEVYTVNPPDAPPSWCIPILWKDCGNLFSNKSENVEMDCTCNTKEEKSKEETEQGIKNYCDIRRKKIKCTCTENPSFFQWYVQPTCASHDCIGATIKDEVWVNPISFLEGESKFPSKWDADFNFVFGRDDLIARKTHGLPYPKELLSYDKLITDHATKMLYYAMNGMNSPERCTVTRLCAGPFLTFVVDEMEDMIRGRECAPKLCLYASHDSTLAGILEALGLWEDKWPPFAAHIRMEVYKDINRPEYYIRFLFCDKVRRIRNQQEDFMHWCDFKKSIMRYMIHEEEFWKVCSSNILEQYAKLYPNNIKYEDVEAYQVKPERPAGM